MVGRYLIHARQPIRHCDQQGSYQLGGNAKTQSSPDQAQQHRFDQQLPDQAQTAGAQGGPDMDFAFAGSVSNDLQADQIRQPDQQYTEHGAEKHPEDLGGIAHDLLEQRRYYDNQIGMTWNSVHSIPCLDVEFMRPFEELGLAVSVAPESIQELYLSLATGP